MTPGWSLDPHRGFSPDPKQRELAGRLFEQLSQRPLFSAMARPRSSAWAADATPLPPAAWLLDTEPGLRRLLRGSGIEWPAAEPRAGADPAAWDEQQDRAAWATIWQVAAQSAGNPLLWRLEESLAGLLGLSQKPSADEGDPSYDLVLTRLADPDMRPAQLIARLGIEHIGLPWGITEDLTGIDEHRAAGLPITPVLWSDLVTDPRRPHWAQAIAALAESSGVAVDDYAGYLRAIRARRESFLRLGATSVDHHAVAVGGELMDDAIAASLYQRLLERSASADDTQRFAAHMVGQMARFSADDGLVMQLHLRSWQDSAGPRHRLSDDAALLPRSLQQLLDDLGDHPGFRLVVYDLDEGEAAGPFPIWAAETPALYLGAPWRSGDGLSAITRYLDLTLETASVGKLAGLMDQAPSLPSLAARHQLWRRCCCDWLAGRVLRGLIDEGGAMELAADLGYRQAKRIFERP